MIRVTPVQFFGALAVAGALHVGLLAAATFQPKRAVEERPPEPIYLELAALGEIDGTTGPIAEDAPEPTTAEAAPDAPDPLDALEPPAPPDPVEQLAELETAPPPEPIERIETLPEPDRAVVPDQPVPPELTELTTQPPPDADERIEIVAEPEPPEPPEVPVPPELAELERLHDIDLARPLDMPAEPPPPVEPERLEIAALSEITPPPPAAPEPVPEAFVEPLDMIEPPAPEPLVMADVAAPQRPTLRDTALRPVVAQPVPVTPPPLAPPAVLPKPPRAVAAVAPPPVTRRPVEPMIMSAAEAAPPPPRLKAKKIETAALATIPPKGLPDASPSKFASESLKKYGRALYQRINTRAQNTYPKRALKRGEQGVVLLRLTVDARGNLLSVDVVDESNATPRLARAAIKAVRSAAPFAEFVDGMTTEPTRFEIPIAYRLR
jgi:TonB family protein